MSVSRGRSVFISYSHTESAAVERLAAYLRSRNVRVVIDTTDLRPGEFVASFIQRSVKEADATVAVVSSDSLASSWVVHELVTTINSESANGSRLIACSLDEDFLQPGFRLRVTARIDERLAEIDRVIKEHLAQRIDVRDLSAEQGRLMDVRSQLGVVLDRLRQTLTLPIGGDDLLPSAARVADRVLGVQVLEVNDIQARHREIRDLIGQDRIQDAIRRLMDYAGDFSDPENVRQAVLISNSVTRLEHLYKTGEMSYDDFDRARGKKLYAALHLIDTILFAKAS